MSPFCPFSLTCVDEIDLNMQGTQVLAEKQKIGTKVCRIELDLLVCVFCRCISHHHQRPRMRSALGVRSKRRCVAVHSPHLYEVPMLPRLPSISRCIQQIAAAHVPNLNRDYCRKSNLNFQFLILCTLIKPHFLSTSGGSGNQLVDPLPASLSKLTALESLDLSSNKVRFQKFGSEVLPGNV